MKLEAVSVCVNYADFLAVSLLWNARHFDNLVIVTDTKDRRTADLCEHHHVRCIKTDAFYEGDRAFDKGAGINAGLAALDRDGWVLHWDADIVLPPRTRALLEAADLDPAMIYGADRLLCQSFEDWQAYATAPEVMHSCNAFVQATAFPLGTRVAAMGEGQDGYVPIGFFQLWNAAESGVLTYPNHGNAGRGDYRFGQQWPRRRRALIPEIVTIHLESETSEMAVNWRGRQSPWFGPAPRRAPSPRAGYAWR